MGKARDAGLDFVPKVFATGDQATTVALAGRLWDLTGWLPGRADFHERPSPPRLEAACGALARLHNAWSGPSPPVGPCPAIQRRLQSHREWTALVDAGWRLAFAPGTLDPVADWAERAWRLLQTRAGRLPLRLAPWAERPVPLQPCLCDVW